MEAINTYTYKYTYIHIHVEDCALQTIQVSKCTEKNISGGGGQQVWRMQISKGFKWLAEEYGFLKLKAPKSLNNLSFKLSNF